MHDTLLVRGGQAARRLGGVVDGLARRYGPGRQPLAQGLALEQLHHHERRTAVGADVEDRADVGVVQRSGGTGLLLEPSDTLGVAGKIGEDDLDGDIAAQAGVVGTVDLARSADSERGDDPVRSEGRA